MQTHYVHTIGNGVQSNVNTLETMTEKIESNKESGTDKGNISFSLS